MSLDECLTKHTHRQFAAWIYWLEEQWNSPNRSDTYMMQIACEVRRVLSSKPSAIKLKDFLLKFSTNKTKDTQPKNNVMISKAAWFAAVGLPKNIVEEEISKLELDEDDK